MKNLKQHGFALAIVMVLVIAITTSIGSAIYYSQQAERDDAKRLLTLQAATAARTILSYQAAWIKQNGFEKITPGFHALEPHLINFLNAAIPEIQTGQCTLFLTRASSTRPVRLSTLNPANYTNPLVGQIAPVRVMGLFTKVVVQAEGSGPSITLYAALPIEDSVFSYFTCGSFFDMDAEYYNLNQGDYYLTFGGMCYSNGCSWSTGNFWFSNSVISIGGMRQTAPSFFADTNAMGSPSNTACNYGATAFTGKGFKWVYNGISNGNGYTNSNGQKETGYYDSISQNMDVPAGDPTNWNEYLKANHLWFVSGTNPFPIPGFPNYKPSSPPAASGSSSRNSLSYAWALLEPPFSTSSTWYKGAVAEQNKFSTQSCLVIRVEPTPSPTYQASWGLPTIETSSSFSPISIATFSGNCGNGKGTRGGSILNPISTPTGYDVYLFSFKRTDPSNLLSPIQTNGSGNCVLQPFGGQIGWKMKDQSIKADGNSVDIKQADFTNTFAIMTPFAVNSKSGNKPALSSFYDARRQVGVDALVIDVGALYAFLTTKNSAFPSYNPTTDYNGIVYIWFPETYFNNMPPHGDGAVNPTNDANYVRTQNGTAVNWGVVLTNGTNVPATADRPKGLTIASNVPVYIHGDYGSGNWPCLVAGDAVTLLSDGFFQSNTAFTPALLYSPYAAVADSVVPAGQTTLNTSIIGGNTAYYLTGNWSGRGDGPINTPRTIENWQGGWNPVTALAINGTIFGLFEPEVATGSVSNQGTDNTKNPVYNPLTIVQPLMAKLPAVPLPLIPPGGAFLKCDSYSLGHIEFVTDTEYNKVTAR